MTQVDSDDLGVTKYQTLGNAICEALAHQAKRVGFDSKLMPEIEWADLLFSIKRDPSNGENCLAGEWKDAHGYLVGQIQFNSDGGFYAERDIVKQHPNDSRWFVEAVEAWGSKDKITTDCRLISNV